MSVLRSNKNVSLLLCNILERVLERDRNKRVLHFKLPDSFVKVEANSVERFQRFSYLFWQLIVATLQTLPQKTTQKKK